MNKWDIFLSKVDTDNAKDRFSHVHNYAVTICFLVSIYLL